jgi:hypothetical protein
MDQSDKIAAANPPMDEVATVAPSQGQSDIELVALSEMPPPLEPEQSRSKFRLAAILIALYVSSTRLSS